MVQGTLWPWTTVSVHRTQSVQVQASLPQWSRPANLNFLLVHLFIVKVFLKPTTFYGWFQKITSVYLLRHGCTTYLSCGFLDLPQKRHALSQAFAAQGSRPAKTCRPLSESPHDCCSVINSWEARVNVLSDLNVYDTTFGEYTLPTVVEEENGR